MTAKVTATVTAKVTATVTRLLRVVTALLATAPATALACPACAAREGPGTSVLVLVGALIAVPYLVAAVAIKVVRKLERQG
jgi:hypothetical protein